MNESIELFEGYRAEPNGEGGFVVTDAVGECHVASAAEAAMIRGIARLREQLLGRARPTLNAMAPTVALATSSRRGMRMAKATPTDLNAALALAGVLDDLEKGDLPFDPEKPLTEADVFPEAFDKDNPSHLQKLHDRVKACLDAAPGGFMRVIIGMVVVLDPRNAILDPNSKVLALHPRLAAKVSDDGITRQ